jgi:hypothetical protein
MYKPFVPALLLSAALSAACGGANPPSNSPAKTSNAQANGAQTSIAHGTSPSANLGVASSHGGGPAAPAAAGQDADRALVDTKELDARIRAAAGKAKASGASAADKKAAAEAYLARGNVYWNGGQPRLYKYALADFRSVLKYDPANAEAKEKIGTIVGIYQGMGKPVPEVNNEP